MAVRIQVRRDTAAVWTAANPVLAAGEPAYETDTGKEKIGDGATAWVTLPYEVDRARMDVLESNAAATAADVTILREAPLNLLYPEFAGLKVGTDWTPALLALISNGDYVHGYLPPGEYHLTAALSRTVPKALHLKGAGVNSTFLVTDNATHLFDLVLAAGGKVTIEDMTLLNYNSAVVGSAIKCDGNYNYPSLSARNVDITRGGMGNEFLRGLDLIDMAEPDLSDVLILGLGPTSVCEAVSIRSLSAATGGSYKISGVSAYGTKWGLRVISAHNPGVEGLQVSECDWVNVETAISYINTLAITTYAPPMLTILGGHSNASLRNIDLKNVVQVKVLGHLAYNSGSLGEFLRAEDSGAIHVADSDFFAVLGGDPGGLELISSGYLGLVDIHDNLIAMEPGSTKWPIRVTGPCSNVQIHDNNASNSTKCVEVTNMTPNVRIHNNMPVDSKDDVESVAVLGTGTGPDPYRIDWSASRSDYIDVVPGTARTIVDLIGRRLGEVVTLNSQGHTLVHGAGIIPLILSGGVNYVFPAGGGRITLRRTGLLWLEVGRA